MKRTPLRTLSAISVALLCVLAMGLTIVAACFKDDLPNLTEMPSVTEAAAQDTSLDRPAEEEDADIKAESPKAEEAPADVPPENDVASEPENKPAVKEEVAEAPARETACEKEDASCGEKASDCGVALPECLTNGEITIEDVEKLLPDCVSGDNLSTEELEKFLSQCCPNGEITIEDVEKLLPDCVNGDNLSAEELEKFLSQCCPNGEITIEDVEKIFPDLQLPAEQDKNEPAVPPASETKPETEAKPTPSVPETLGPETSAPEAPKPEASAPEASASSVSAYERRVVELVNEIRRENGLGELTLNEELSAVAREKSRDMKEKGYFDHQSPTYGSPFDMMKAFGITYRTAGENIAMGYPTPEEVVDGWMNSDGHRANILNASFTEIGVGYVENGHYWTQMFIG